MQREWQCVWVREWEREREQYKESVLMVNDDSLVTRVMYILVYKQATNGL